MEKFLKFLICIGLAAVAFVPIAVKSDFFFPFIYSKALLFRSVIEIIFLLYVWLAFLNTKYRPRINILTIAFSIYIGIVTVSSIIFGNFYLSFWGDVERSEGIITLLHLFALLLIISGIIKNKKDWLILFDITVLSSILVSFVALGQKLNWDFILNNGDPRISSTTGNPAYLASYLIFTIFFALFLYFQRSNKFLKFYYILIVLFEAFIITQTATRGAFIGLIAALFVGTFLVVFFTNVNSKIKKGFTIFLLLSIVFGITVIANKEASWVKDNIALQRMVNISLKDRTTETRLLTWNSAWQGIKEKPLLGWGYENFNIVFNKYFEPNIYEDASSRVWFDRAHNVIFDRAVTGGILGLLAFLFISLYPVYFLGKKLMKERSNNNDEVENEVALSVVFISLFVAYFVQNLFVFDSLINYIPLIFALGFIGFYDKEKSFKLFEKKIFYQYLLAFIVIIFIPVFYAVNIKTAKANTEIVDAMQLVAANENEAAYNKFLHALSYNTYGNQEYRVRLTEFADNIIYKKEGSEDFRSSVAYKTNEELQKQITEQPNDVANLILTMRHYNRAYVYNIRLLDEVKVLFDKAIILSPTRPQLYYELAYSQVYLGKYYQGLKQDDKAQQYFDEAISSFNKSIELNDDVIESYVNTIVMALLIDKTDVVLEKVEKMDKMGLNYKTIGHLKRMASAAVNSKHYDWSLKFYSEIVKVEPSNPQNFVDLSLSYVYTGDIEKAIATAEEVKKFGDQYVEKADQFIKQISDPAFDINKLGQQR